MPNYIDKDECGCCGSMEKPQAMLIREGKTICGHCCELMETTKWSFDKPSKQASDAYTLTDAEKEVLSWGAISTE